jgi:hypothetical protein
MTIFKVIIIRIWVLFEYLFAYSFFCVDLVCFLCASVNVSVYVALCGWVRVCVSCEYCVCMFLIFFSI